MSDPTVENDESASAAKEENTLPEPTQEPLSGSTEYDHDEANGVFQQQHGGANGHHIAATGMPELPSRPAYKLPEETEAFILQAEAELAAMGESSPAIRQLAERGKIAFIRN